VDCSVWMSSSALRRRGEKRRICSFDHHLSDSLLEFQDKCIVRALTPSDASRRHR
jgi:hypothetical protein